MGGIKFSDAGNGGGVVGAANGLSLDNINRAVLGQNVGEAGNPAALLNDREIPVNPGALTFQDLAFPENKVKIGDNGFGTFQFKVEGDSVNASLPVVIISDLDPGFTTEWRIYAQGGQLLIDENISAINVITFTPAFVRCDVQLRCPAGISYNQTVINNAISAVILSGISTSGQINTNSGAAGAIVLTLPVPILGSTYKFYVAAAFNLTIQATAGVAIRNGALLKAAPGNLVNNVIGSFITLVAMDATTWVAESQSGGWI